MAYDFASDLDTIFNTDELAEDATYIQSGYPAASIPVIFTDEFALAELVGETEMGLPDPQARCKTADAPNAARGDTLAIRGVTYYVQEARPNGKGVTLLILSKDE